MKQRKYKWIRLYCLVLAAFPVYFLLDTFVIARVYSAEGTSGAESSQPAQTAASQSEPASPQGEAETQSGSDTQDSTQNGSSKQGGTANSAITKSTTPIITENSYTDENIQITITEYEAAGTTIYVADVQVSSPEYLKTALAKGVYGRNVTASTSSTAKSAGAILAINGDYYGAQQQGYVIRNGVLYRSTSAGREDLVIYSNGSFGIITEGQISAQQLINDGAQQVLSFGPALVEDGQISVSVSTEVGRAMASNPRTAIGIVDDQHYLFVVSDGRTSESEGLTLYQLAQVMQQLGAKTAYNLDGGGSSTMYFNGKVINNPTTNGGTISERSVSDIVYIGY